MQPFHTSAIERATSLVTNPKRHHAEIQIKSDSRRSKMLNTPPSRSPAVRLQLSATQRLQSPLWPNLMEFSQLQKGKKNISPPIPKLPLSPPHLPHTTSPFDLTSPILHPSPPHNLTSNSPHSALPPQTASLNRNSIRF
jgi:hypothetical protein